MPPPYVGYLRVYQPLGAFDPAERDRWKRYFADVEPPSRANGPREERRAALRAAVRTRLPDTADGTGGEPAYVLFHEGVPLLCPWQTRIRSAEALADFLTEMPEPLARAFWPAPGVRTVADELAAAQAEQPDVPVAIQMSTWSVPARWFVLFDQHERVLLLESGERALLWRTEMGKARRRVARALATLRRSAEETVVAEAVEMLARWLEQFHPRSVIELDYGGLAFLFDEKALRADTSAADVADSLSALADGDGERAGEGYERLVARWRPAQLQANTN